MPSTIIYQGSPRRSCMILGSPPGIDLQNLVKSSAAQDEQQPCKNNRYVKFFVIQFCMWWFFSSMYNIEVKKFLKLNSLPLQATFLSLVLSSVCVVAFSKKKALINSNSFSLSSFRKLFFISMLHLIGTASTNYSISLMAVSFTNVVKAGEPVFTMFWTLFLTKVVVSNAKETFSLSPLQFVSVLVIVGGVILASIMETTFSLSGLLWGLLSNVCFSGRNVMSKRAMAAMQIDRDALFLVLNATGAAVAFGLVLVFEREFGLSKSSKEALFYSSMYFFMDTAISINILSSISPVSHAISNTCKRSIVFITSSIVFGTSTNILSVVGAYVTMFGVAVYSVSSSIDFSIKNDRREMYKKLFAAMFVMGLLFFCSSKVTSDVQNSVFPSFDNDAHPANIDTYGKIPVIIDDSVHKPYNQLAEEYTLKTKLKPTNVPLVENLQAFIWRHLQFIFQGYTHAVIMDHPDHKNRGDSAIYVGEVAFLKKLGIELVYECAHLGDTQCNITHIKEVLNPETGIVLLHGGGNFGDIYNWYEDMRQNAILALADYRIFVFPQTVHYWNMDNAIATAAKYATVPDLTIGVRDQKSHKLVKEFFPTNRPVLSPDMAFMMGPLRRVVEPSVDFVMVFRKDAESQLNDVGDIHKYVRSLINNDDITFTIGDWEDGDVDGIWNYTSLTDRAQVRTNDAIKYLSQGRVVISDRLHCHILSTLLDIPHVNMDNYYGKVTKFHDRWMREQNPRMFKMEKSLKQAVESALEMLEASKKY